MNELKPCPFCGGEAIYVSTNIKAIGAERTFYSVSCLDCNVNLYRYFKTKEEAVEAWNRRATDDN